MTSNEAVEYLNTILKVANNNDCCNVEIDAFYEEAIKIGINALKALGKLQNVELGHWEEYEFKSIIPAEWDDDGNLVLHKYIGHKCNICGNKIGREKTNYCSECGTKMKMD